MLSLLPGSWILLFAVDFPKLGKDVAELVRCSRACCSAAFRLHLARLQAFQLERPTALSLLLADELRYIQQRRDIDGS